MKNATDEALLTLAMSMVELRQIEVPEQILFRLESRCGLLLSDGIVAIRLCQMIEDDLGRLVADWSQDMLEDSETLRNLKSIHQIIISINKPLRIPANLPSEIFSEGSAYI